jgi:hypothetical protein
MKLTEFRMKRRKFLGLIGGAVTLPMAARAQQAPLPVIGFLHSASLEPNARRLAGFHSGLRQAGFFAGALTGGLVPDVLRICHACNTIKQ